MRILQFINFIRDDIGGPTRAVIDLCDSLSRRGNTVTLVTIDGTDAPHAWRNGAPTEAPADGAPTMVVLKDGLRLGHMLTAAALRRVRALVADHDVAHVHGVWEPTNAQVCREAARAGKPYFVSSHGMLDDWCMAQSATLKRAYLALVGRRFLERAAGVHMTAQAELTQSRKWFPGGRGVVVPNLLDLEPYRRLPGPELARRQFPALRDGRPAVLFLSRLHVKKGLEVLLRSARLLRDRASPVTLLIAGGGEPAYLESLRACARACGLTDQEAVFLGPVVGDLKYSLYQACTVFALPTSQENFGFVFPEALACELPVVTTRGVDIWPELESSGGAVIAEPTPEAFADAIGGLLAQPERLPEMGRKGRAWVFSALDPALVIKRFEAMYRQEI